MVLFSTPLTHTYSSTWFFFTSHLLLAVQLSVPPVSVPQPWVFLLVFPRALPLAVVALQLFYTVSWIKKGMLLSNVNAQQKYTIYSHLNVKN